MEVETDATGNSSMLTISVEYGGDLEEEVEAMAGEASVVEADGGGGSGQSLTTWSGIPHCQQRILLPAFGLLTPFTVHSFTICPFLPQR